MLDQRTNPRISMDVDYTAAKRMEEVLGPGHNVNMVHLSVHVSSFFLTVENFYRSH